MLDRRKALALMFYTGHQRDLNTWETTRHIYIAEVEWSRYAHHLWRLDVPTGIASVELSNVDPMDRKRGYAEGESVRHDGIQLPPDMVDGEMRFDLMEAASSLRDAISVAQVRAANGIIAGLAESE